MKHRLVAFAIATSLFLPLAAQAADNALMDKVRINAPVYALLQVCDLRAINAAADTANAVQAESPSTTPSTPRWRRQFGGPSRRTGFLAPRASIRCVRRWESSRRRPQSQPRSRRGRRWPKPTRRPHPRPPPASSWAGCHPTADPSHGARPRERSALKATQWVAFDTLQRMYVRWQTYRSQALNPWQRECNDRRARLKAVLVENVRVNGKPRQRYVAFLGSLTFEPIGFDSSRSRLWRNVTTQLERLGNRISPEDRDRILASIAARVGGGPPTAAELEQFERDSDALRARLRAIASPS